MQKISALDDGQKDFKEIFKNLDEYINNNKKHKINIEDDTDPITNAINKNSINKLNGNKEDVNNSENTIKE